jgi:hypothetical protein
MAKKLPMKAPSKAIAAPETGYADIVGGIVDLLEAARRASARSVNSVMTATYWEIGRRIVECEQAGERRAEYGAEVLKRLSADFSERFGRRFGLSNLKQMRMFYLGFANAVIGQTVSDQSHSKKGQTPSGLFTAPQDISLLVLRFPLPWSHYVRLFSVKKDDARRFYEAEAIRGGWSVRQLERQLDTQFYERALLSRQQTSMLVKGQKPLPTEMVTADEEVKDPYRARSRARLWR